MIHAEVYNDFLEKVMAIPSYLGIKPASERFAGAINSMTAEGMMRDGKALQLATSHELGQNFARAFDIFFQNEEGQAALCYTTSWGSSTRYVGGLIMAHGDDNGLVMPPQLAPTQAVVVAVRDEADVNDACAAVARDLAAGGVRIVVDRGRGSFGRRITDWEIKGIPLRIEVGPRDLAQGVVSVVRRDNGEKATISLESLRQHAVEMLDAMQQDMFAAALKFRDGATHEVKTVGEAMEAAQQGFAKLPWDAVGPDGEAELKTDAITVRCLQRADGSMPDEDTEKNLVCIVAKSY
jgi:prolyl-tRNA synthetase